MARHEAPDSADQPGTSGTQEADPLAAAAAAGPLPANADDFTAAPNHEAFVRHQDTGVIPIQDPDLDPEGVAQDTAGNNDSDETITVINMRS